MKKKSAKILIFISRESATFNFVSRQVEMSCGATGRGGAQIEVIDIADHPDLAEKYNIEALPTIVVGERRYVGLPNAEVLNTCMGTMTDLPPIKPEAT